MEIQQLFHVKDKVVLVTGGGRGVGEHIAEGFVVNGAKVYITGRKREALDSTCSRLNQLGKGKCYAIQCNLSDSSALQNLIEELNNKEKEIHVLVNNAGGTFMPMISSTKVATWGSELEDIDMLSYDRVMNLNVKSLLFLTLGLLPLLKAAGRAEAPSRIINIGSIQGLVTGRNSPVYDASKAAVHQLTKSLAAQLVEKKVLVNAIALGVYETSMTKGLIEMVGRDTAKHMIPIGRPGLPHEIAGMCLFLASRASSYVIGSTIVMDGGVIARKSVL